MRQGKMTEREEQELAEESTKAKKYDLDAILAEKRDKGKSKRKGKEKEKEKEKGKEKENGKEQAKDAETKTNTGTPKLPFRTSTVSF